MNDLGQQVENKANAKSTPSDVHPLKLALQGNVPTTVYVIPVSSTVAGFSLTATGTPVTGGLQWQHNGEFAMFVTFQLTRGITSVDCDGLPYSDVYVNSIGPAQDLCILATNAEFPFDVTLASGVKHDPKIVVTPASSTSNAT